MEHIFRNLMFENNKGIIQDCSILVQFTNSFFLSPKNWTIDFHFFHFGLLFESLHYKRNDQWRANVFSPTRTLFKGVIDDILIGSIQQGRDLNNELNEAEADTFDPYYWRIKKAIANNRPDWAFYMLLGNLQGLFNGGRITAVDFLWYLKLFPNEFIKSHRDKLQYAFNSFDEIGCLLSLNEDLELLKIGNKIYSEIELDYPG